MRILFCILFVASVTITAQNNSITKNDIKTDNDKLNYSLGYNYSNMIKSSGVKTDLKMFLNGFIKGMQTVIKYEDRPPEPENKNNPDEQNESYSLGYSFGELIRDGGVELNKDIFYFGLIEGINSNPKIISDEEFNSIITKAAKDIASHQVEKIKMDSPDYHEGLAFLEENKKAPGVVTLPSGLQYKILGRSGKSIKPTKEDTLTVNYEGKLLSDKVFESTFRSKRPLRFTLNRVIKGWVEGIQLMNLGDKFEFYIPYDLAYGARGAGKDIPPFSTIIFTVELLEIKHK